MMFARRLFPTNPVFLCCDVQPLRVAKHMPRFDDVVFEADRLARIASIMQIPFVVSEMFPDRLGPTDSRVTLPTTLCHRFAKQQFSMMTPEVRAVTVDKGAKDFVLFGIETHACILQTAANLLELRDDIHIWVIENATFSIHSADRESALAWLRGERRVTVATAEMFCGTLVREGAASPSFVAVTDLVVKKRQPFEAAMKQAEFVQKHALQ